MDKFAMKIIFFVEIQLHKKHYKKTYRPLEVDVELNGLEVCLEVVTVPDHRGDLLPEGAHASHVHVRHVMLQAHAELGRAQTRAHAGALRAGAVAA